MSLSYRELSIWIHVAVIGVLYGLYFALFGRSFFAGSLAEGRWLGLFILVTIIIILSEALLQGVLAAFNSRAANQALDERDQQIESQATKLAYYILVAGLWLGLGSLLISSSPIFMFNIIFFFYIQGALVGYLYQIVSYRRAA